MCVNLGAHLALANHRGGGSTDSRVVKEGHHLAHARARCHWLVLLALYSYVPILLPVNEKWISHPRTSWLIFFGTPVRAGPLGGKKNGVGGTVGTPIVLDWLSEVRKAWTDVMKLRFVEVLRKRDWWRFRRKHTSKQVWMLQNMFSSL